MSTQTYYTDYQSTAPNTQIRIHTHAQTATQLTSQVKKNVTKKMPFSHTNAKSHTPT